MRICLNAVCVLIVGLAMAPCQSTYGEPLRQDAPPPAALKAIGAREIIPVPTLGGMQFWADELFFHKWRIQRNVVTGHCRLVDENSLRHAFGTFDHCQAVLEEIKRDRKLPPMQGKGVILVHGLAGPRTEMIPLANYLEREGKFTVFNVGYPSTRRGIDEHAKTLAGIVAHLDGIAEINFVGFSMGNVVVRRYLSATDLRSVPAVAANGHPADGARRPDRRIKRFVMLGPPNHGAELATQLRGNPAAKLLLGESLDQLGERRAWEELRLGTPPCEFGIIAGGLGNNRGFNPTLPGDNDGIVTVASARLAGASDFIRVPLVHSLLPYSAKVEEYTLRFLQHGYFIAPEQRRPVRGKDEG
jgi:pimeloyl-ACP methyl ester carboxylesterase